MTKKTINIILLALIIVGIGAGAYFYRQRPRKEKAQKNKPSHNITVNLSEDIRQKIENDIKAKQKIINDANALLNDKTSAYLVLGIDYETLGQRDMEEEAFMGAGRLQPTSYLPWGNLATLYAEEGDNVAAAKAFEKAINMAPHDVQLWQKYLDFDRYKLRLTGQDMKNQFAAAFATTNDDLYIHRLYASYLEDTGEITAAINQWQYIASKDPNDKIAKKEIDRLKAKQKSK